jgi:hypothetical protein
LTFCSGSGLEGDYFVSLMGSFSSMSERAQFALERPFDVLLERASAATDWCRMSFRARA